MRRRLPEPLGLNRETLRLMERAVVAEERANPLVVAALAELYGRRAKDLSPLAAERIGRLVELLRGYGP